ncbi:MAG: cysteine--tRNA ligase [Leptospiraceae bacterium]|nr:cysteine--tRNA ligase [Leptospiraceae bacterium]
MALQFYNSLSRSREVFRPAKAGHVRIYSCGPTVYNRNHIGNFRAYVFNDLLRRYLKYSGYQVEHAMNITDVEDKIIRNASAAKKSIQDFTRPWIEHFLADLEWLQIENVEHRPRATDSIPEMTAMVQRLLEQGHAYRVDGNVYFRLQSFDAYGQLSGIAAEELRTAADGRFDADEYTKENVRDFALWKAASPLDHTCQAVWPAEFGDGRPGWHLECSAMIRRIFGQDGIDIHTGGIDLFFPHHENEIAQSCAAWPKESFVRYWLHNEHLLVDGQKMSKSAGNFYTLFELRDPVEAQKLVEAKRAPELLLELLCKNQLKSAMRYMLISTHYRQKLNFGFSGLQAAQSSIKRLFELLLDLLGSLDLQDRATDWFEEQYYAELTNSILPEHDTVGQRLQAAFQAAMDDDLNIARALAAIFQLPKDIGPYLKQSQNAAAKSELASALREFLRINTVLRILPLENRCQTANAAEYIDTALIQAKITERNAARTSRDFARADEIRDELLAMGIRIKDHPQGTDWEILL